MYPSLTAVINNSRFSEGTRFGIILRLAFAGRW